MPKPTLFAVNRRRNALPIVDYWSLRTASLGLSQLYGWNYPQTLRGMPSILDKPYVNGALREHVSTTGQVWKRPLGHIIAVSGRTVTTVDGQRWGLGNVEHEYVRSVATSKVERARKKMEGSAPIPARAILTAEERAYCAVCFTEWQVWERGTSRSNALLVLLPDCLNNDGTDAALRWAERSELDIGTLSWKSASVCVPVRVAKAGAEDVQDVLITVNVHAKCSASAPREEN